MKIAHVEIDGAAIRYLETGDGPPLVHLVEPGALRPGPAHARLAERFRVVLLEVMETAPLARAVERLAPDRLNLLGSGQAARTAVELTLAAPARILALALESPGALEDVALEPRLAGITAPTLVLLGARVGAAGRAWSERIPGAHLVYVYDAGHAIAAERPDAFADVVADFLERHDAFVISRASTVIHP